MQRRSKKAISYAHYRLSCNFSALVEIHTISSDYIDLVVSDSYIESTQILRQTKKLYELFLPFSDILFFKKDVFNRISDGRKCVKKKEKKKWHRRAYNYKQMRLIKSEKGEYNETMHKHLM